MHDGPGQYLEDGRDGQSWRNTLVIGRKKMQMTKNALNCPTPPELLDLVTWKWICASDYNGVNIQVFKTYTTSCEVVMLRVWIVETGVGSGDIQADRRT